MILLVDNFLSAFFTPTFFPRESEDQKNDKKDIEAWCYWLLQALKNYLRSTYSFQVINFFLALSCKQSH